jgi:hypothetical protein
MAMRHLCDNNVQRVWPMPGRRRPGCTSGGVAVRRDGHPSQRTLFLQWQESGCHMVQKKTSRLLYPQSRPTDTNPGNPSAIMDDILLKMLGKIGFLTTGSALAGRKGL